MQKKLVHSSLLLIETYILSTVLYFSRWVFRSPTNKNKGYRDIHARHKPMNYIVEKNNMILKLTFLVHAVPVQYVWEKSDNEMKHMQAENTKTETFAREKYPSSASG